MSLATCGAAGSKFLGKIDFSKNYVLSCGTLKGWAAGTGSLGKFAASPGPLKAILRRRQVKLPQNF
jgi:hypothetical protein